MVMSVAKLDVVVLGLLSDEPLYGYDLLERFRDRSMGFWVDVAKASVYQVLKRLERDGSIAGKAQDGTRGPDRRVYTITRAGRERLRRGLIERFGALTPYETDAGIALGFANLLSPAEARLAVDARERAVRDLLDAVNTELDRSGVRSGSRRPAAGRAISTAMLRRQLALAEAELAWLRTFRATLAKGRR
jgi:DNA-binding PadR family transcriptional regulator